MRIPSRTHPLNRLILVLACLLIAQALYLPAKAVAAQFLLELAWHRTQATGVEQAPWPWADTKTLAQIRFPEHNQRFILLASSVGRTLAFAPGHLTGSSLPGERGHMVISAHRDTHFAVLEDIAPGHTIEVLAHDDRLQRYKVRSIRILDSRYEQLQLAHATDQLTLITCYPFDALQAGGPLRLRIDATLLD